MSSLTSKDARERYVPTGRPVGRPRQAFRAEIDAFIASNYLTMTDGEMAETLRQTLGINATKQSVQHARLNVGLRRERSGGPKVWTREMREYIIENAANMWDAEIAKGLGVTKRAVACERQGLGVWREKGTGKVVRVT